MTKELTTISPEGLEIANSYILLGNIKGVAQDLGVTEYAVTQTLGNRSVKKYIDAVYFDRGYRNRNQLGALLDEMIASKLEEAIESGIYTNKDLADLMMMAHKMRMEELKVLGDQEKTSVGSQTNIQINDAGQWGQGNYGKLMETIYGNILPG